MAIQVTRRCGFTIVENAIMDDERVSMYALLVYLALARHADTDKRCWPSWTRLAQLARCKRSTVATALRELETLGYLTIERRPGHSSLYILGVPVHELDGSSPPHGRVPVHHMDPEQDPIEQDPMKLDVAPEAPSGNGTEAKECLDYHFENHVRVRGFRPVLAGARDMKLIKTILRTYDVGAFKEVDDMFFAWEKRSDFSIPALFRKFDVLYGVALDKAGGKRR